MCGLMARRGRGAGVNVRHGKVVLRTPLGLSTPSVRADSCMVMHKHPLRTFAHLARRLEGRTRMWTNVARRSSCRGDKQGSGLSSNGLEASKSFLKAYLYCHASLRQCRMKVSASPADTTLSTGH